MTSKKAEPETAGDDGDVAPESLKFEDAIARLEDIVRRMEVDQVPLDELISDYEAGTRLLRVCRARIETARARIEQIGQSSEDGDVALGDFEPGADEASGADDGKNIRLF